MFEWIKDIKEAKQNCQKLESMIVRLDKETSVLKTQISIFLHQMKPLENLAKKLSSDNEVMHEYIHSALEEIKEVKKILQEKNTPKRSYSSKPRRSKKKENDV